MKKYLIVIALVLLSFPAQAQEYEEYNTFGVVVDNSKEPVVLFFNSWYEETLEDYPTGEWITVDISDLIPADTGAVFFSGILIITHGLLQQTCNLQIGFRSFGSDYETSDLGWYSGQVIEAHGGGGQRSTYSTWVPVKDGKFQFKWTRNTYAQWPTSCAYGVNLTPQAYVR